MSAASDTALLQNVLHHSANESLLSYLTRFEVPAELETDWEEMRRRSWSIGTLPEVVDLLWIDFAKKVPETCRAIFMNRPVLFNPESGEIFGFATGTYAPMVKFRGEALLRTREIIGESGLAALDRADGDIREVGADWVYCSSSLPGVVDLFAEAYLLTQV